ncbi:Permease of the drug/metabolite transporter (DMT) superfamily [Devosia enhydra]|uniref:Permease of the drug/metabolite transporter (DMT) superfamily n=1 Tax=Devosia enhydra TaxID=665118 RepID=A0A1K2HWS3_9HYPH|nr:DMT family transporter [Devosia enhydra]SFZ83544.1 Permease of the drug/metabolite transporter (DMT) superfamily [Devosia enhydra]
MPTHPSAAPVGGRTGGLLDRPYLILVLTVAFWGGNVVAGKAAVGHIDPYALMILRWTGAFLFVLPFALRYLRRDLPVLKANWWLLAIYGGLGFATFNMLVYIAAYFTSGVNNALDQVTVNIFVMGLNFLIFRTRVKLLQLVGVAISIMGVAVTATHGDLTRILALDINFGDLLVIIACFAYAIYSLLLRYRPPTHWLSFLTTTVAAAALASVLFQAFVGGGLASFIAAVPGITPLGWLIVAYTVLFPSLISQFFYVRGVELIGANRASLFINLIPFFGALGSVLILGERLEGFHFAAGGLIIIGIVLAEWSARRSA